MFDTLLYHTKTIIGNLIHRSESKDDFNWDHYSDHYKGELKDIAKTHTMILNRGDCTIANGNIEYLTDIKPLHPNHQLLYETIIQLHPVCIMEIGCGGGDHLHNISLLAPRIRQFGIDISQQQVDLLHQRHPDLNSLVKVLDIAQPHIFDYPVADVVFTQAVLMHMQTDSNHLSALINIFHAARNQVVLMENWTKHNFMNDIKQVHHLLPLRWNHVHFYYRSLKDTDNPKLMIVSNARLDYPELKDYSILTDQQTQ